MNRFVETAHQKAMKFIALYNSGASSRVIAEQMGWNTTRPNQMVSRQKARLRARGYEITNRQEQDHG